MVQVINVTSASNADGEEFFMLTLQGGVEMVQSKRTGRFYATARKCKVSTTFDEQTAERMVGQELPGDVRKVRCEPYEYVTPEGEVLELSHRWEYAPEETSMEETVFEGELETA